MMPHYDAMKAAYEKITDNKVKKQCADVVSGTAFKKKDYNSVDWYYLVYSCLTYKCCRWLYYYYVPVFYSNLDRRAPPDHHRVTLAQPYFEFDVSLTSFASPLQY